MDWSPIFISMKTASVSIVITFFLGILAAWAVVSIRSRALKTMLDGILTLPLVLPPTVAGFFFAVSVRRQAAHRKVFYRLFQYQNRLFLVCDGHCGGYYVVPADVPLRQGSL